MAARPAPHAKASTVEAVSGVTAVNARQALRNEITLAFTTLEKNSGEGGLWSGPATASIAACIAETRRSFDREGVRIALIGERRTWAWLDAYLSAPVFGTLDARGAELVIVVRNGERAFSALRRDGARVEMAREADDVELRVQIESMRAELSRPLVPAAIEPSSWWSRLWLRIRNWWRPQTTPRPPDPQLQLRTDLARLEELARQQAVRQDEFFVHLRQQLHPAAGVVQLDLSWPMQGGESVVLYDLRGAMARVHDETWALVRDEIDACILDLDGSSLDTMAANTRQLARELAKIAPRVWVAASEIPARLGELLGVDASRISCVAPPFSREVLAERALDQRALMGALRAIAALRLAQQGLDEVRSQAEARDQQALEELASHGVPSGNRRRDETHRKVGGAVAGRALRIMESVSSILSAELATLRDERAKAVTAARSTEEVRREVGAVGPALAAIPAKLALFAESAMHEAMSQLGPALFSDLEHRIELVNAALSRPRQDLPSWPAAPRVTALDENTLVEHLALASGGMLHADIGWTDSFRSLGTIKQRCAQALDQNLEQLTSAAESELLDLEPRLASRLQEALEIWLDTASDAYSAWLDAAIADERRHRDRVRGQRLAGVIATRDALAEHAQRIASLNRPLAGERSRQAHR